MESTEKKCFWNNKDIFPSNLPCPPSKRTSASLSAIKENLRRLIIAINDFDQNILRIARSRQPPTKFVNGVSIIVLGSLLAVTIFY